MAINSPPFKGRDDQWEPHMLTQKNLAIATETEIERELMAFQERLNRWCQRRSGWTQDQAIISVETPVFKGGWLIPCIESVLQQTSSQWTLALFWDQGDVLAKRILKIVELSQHPQLQVQYATENLGIARSRHFLTRHTTAPWFLPLDDDDILPPQAIAEFVSFIEDKPHSGIVRARRQFIDESGYLINEDDWFPFEPRNSQLGMTTDIYNHSQPYLISRKAYHQTTGWEGFPDFFYAGEDCDIFLKIEEVAPIELLDQVLYYYRQNHKRTSHQLQQEGAFEMWRRLADKTIQRRQLSIKRINRQPPYQYTQR